MEARSRNSTHVVLCTSRGKGHVNPIMTLSCKLATLGLSVTVVFPDEATMSLVSSANQSPSAGLDIELVKLPVEIPAETEAESRNTAWDQEMSGVRQGVRNQSFKLSIYNKSWEIALEELLGQMMTGPSPPAGVIVDMVLAWTEKPITKLGLPRFQFYTSGGIYLALMLVARSLYKQGILPIHQDDKVQMKEKLDHLHVPGIIVKLRWFDVPYGISDDTNSLHEVHLQWLDHVLTSDGILFNTFSEFDGALFDALRTEFQEMSCFTGFVFPVGPLFPNEYFGDEAVDATKKSSIIRGSADHERLCQEWLDSQPPMSVVYISFGSWALLSRDQIRELAVGIEASQHRFLWVLPVESKSNEELEKLLPEGFMDRNAAKGLVLPGWALQNFVLSHSSTGSFLSHCGWNSTLECITLAGVPMICWPFLADQLPNARYLVDGVRIGVEVLGEAEGLVTAAEVERVVKQAMEGPESDGMRSRAKALKAAAKKAVEEGGSSHKNLQEFVTKIVGFNKDGGASEIKNLHINV